MLIAHTTTLTEADDKAFELAVALCARSGARLATVYAGAPQSDLPRPDLLLRRWGSRSEVKQDRIVRDDGDDIAETVLDMLKRLQPALVVCSTHTRTGIERVLAGSVAEAVARNLPCPTLLLPAKARTFVDSASGALRLERMLVPAQGPPVARAAIGACALLSRLAAIKGAEIVLVHAEDGSPAPHVETPAGFTITRKTIHLPLEERLLQTASETNASVIVMATRGHDSLPDIVFGSHTERVLHGSPCPLLWVPMP
jgi:nucleotide-binding universal stress UspA family protein